MLTWFVNFWQRYIRVYTYNSVETQENTNNAYSGSLLLQTESLSPPPPPRGCTAPASSFLCPFSCPAPPLSLPARSCQKHCLCSNQALFLERSSPGATELIPSLLQSNLTSSMSTTLSLYLIYNCPYPLSAALTPHCTLLFLFIILFISPCSILCNLLILFLCYCLSSLPKSKLCERQLLFLVCQLIHFKTLELGLAHIRAL